MNLDAIASPEHRERQWAHHRRHEPYGTHGYRWAPDVIDLMRETGSSSILDYGAGKGSLAAALRVADYDLDIREFDPGIPRKSALPEPADLVTCFDALIYVEQNRLEAVLEHIKALARKAVFLNVPFHPEHWQNGPDAGKRWFVGLEPRHWVAMFYGRWPHGKAEMRRPAKPGGTEYLLFKGDVA